MKKFLNDFITKNNLDKLPRWAIFVLTLIFILSVYYVYNEIIYSIEAHKMECDSCK